MAETTQLAHVYVLLDTKRYQDAETRLRELLAHTPNSARTHALLAYTLYLQDRDTDALHEAEVAIGQEPDNAFHHYIRALALLALARLNSAMKAIQEALRLEPDNARHHAVVSRIYARKKIWKKALAAAEEGLRFDPQNVQCTNLRGMALVNLGRRDEAHQAIATALARDPENALTHANQGWALLHNGDHRQALEHFGEALRLNPMLDWARQGIVEALKARNPVYRLMLRYFLWMSRLSRQEQWETMAIVGGVWRALRIVARAVPVLYVIVLPIALLWFLFAVLTWTARPLFALFLRFDRLGRLALPKEEIVASNWVGACLLISGGGTALAALLGLGTFLWQLPLLSPAFLTLALATLAMIVPIAGVFRCNPGWGRVVLIVYSALMGLIGFAAFVCALFWPWGMALTVVLAGAFGTAWVLYSWIASLIIVLAQKSPE